MRSSCDATVTRERTKWGMLNGVAGNYTGTVMSEFPLVQDQSDQAAREKSRDDQQYERRAHLCHHQHVAERLPASSHSVSMLVDKYIRLTSPFDFTNLRATGI